MNSTHLHTQSQPTRSSQPLPVNLVIPMAGEGSRFQQAGYQLPKPLIKAQEKAMFEWAVASFAPLLSQPERFQVQLIFIVLARHVASHHIDQVVLSKYPQAQLIVLEGLTQGQAQTVLAAKKQINNDQRLIIYNSDTYAPCHLLLPVLENEQVDGGLSCFWVEPGNPRYSFVQLANDKQDHRRVVQVAEKEQISNWATSGLYYFRRGADFISSCEHMIEAEDKSGDGDGEYYVAPLYNHLIKQGKLIRMVSCSQVWVLGTPAELAEFETNYRESDMKYIGSAH